MVRLQCQDNRERWCSRVDSNDRVTDLGPAVLPAELREHMVNLVGLDGIEPPTPLQLSKQRALSLSYSPLWVNLLVTTIDN